MKKEVIAVFDIGKTNKKLLLFDRELKVLEQREERFETTVDEDGFECDDLEALENWIREVLSALVTDERYDLLAVNFTTYGASLAFLDVEGKRLTPLYNYLKEIPSDTQEELFSRYGGQAEFCRRTASPALGKLLNPGVQVLWLKSSRPEVFRKVENILNFPQYLSYLLTGKVLAEPTYLGCHSFFWDFDRASYHQWVKDEGLGLPEPRLNEETVRVSYEGKELEAGTGIHDSSASLVPYLRSSDEPFLLLSTGTWCVSMNPFNPEPLSAEELEADCLCYMSVDRKPVKSNMLFMGHIHDVNTARLAEHFKVPAEAYKTVKPDSRMLSELLLQGKKKLFFKHGVPESYVDEQVEAERFCSFTQSYHRLMYDLTLLVSEAMDLISSGKEGLKRIYISGGFARNEIFVRLLASFYPGLEVLTSEVDNASALGAALVVWKAFEEEGQPALDLGLKSWEGF